MKLTINRMLLENFKGVKQQEIVFDGKNTRVLGVNSSGKTTLADAWYFLWADCNTALVKNPPITPINLPEALTRVEIELTLDGKPLTVAKIQKFRSKEVDGKVTSSVTNSYEINSVEKTERDFVKDLTSRGIDLENFLTFSHPAAFTSDTSKKGREKMRALLFKMCEGVVDGELANDVENVKDLKKLLDIYTLDEIEQMNKATIKRINELTGGPNNNIINARIDELLSQKSNADGSVLNEQKKSYEAEIARCEKELADLSGNKADIKQKISDLRIKKTEITNKANEELNEQKYELDKKIREMTRIIDEQSFKLSQTESEITRKESLLSEAHQDIENQRIKYKIEQDAVIDEGDLVCSLCKQTYPEAKRKQMKVDFEKNKAEKLKSIKSMGEDLKAKIKALDEEIDALFTDKENYTKLVEETKKLRDDAQARADELPINVDMSSNEEYVKVVEDIEKLESQLNASDDDRRNEIESSRDVARQMLNQIIGELSVLEKNKDLDIRIEQLREQRKDSEINRAKAESILDQCERFKKAKNDLLSEKINSHFNFAQFRLFKILRNGSVEESLDILIQGKEINTQVNQASQILAKLDIIKGLSDYFNIWLPVFVDDFALFTEDSEKKITMNNQLIKLVATDKAKELTVEYEV